MRLGASANTHETTTNTQLSDDGRIEASSAAQPRPTYDAVPALGSLPKIPSGVDLALSSVSSDDADKAGSATVPMNVERLRRLSSADTQVDSHAPGIEGNKPTIPKLEVTPSSLKGQLPGLALTNLLSDEQLAWAKAERARIKVCARTRSFFANHKREH
jgi:hypothetical protein